MCVCVSVSVSVCVVSVIVKLSVLPPSGIDWCYRNPFHHYYYYQVTLHTRKSMGSLRNMAFLTKVLKLLEFHDTSTNNSQEGDSAKEKS